MTVTASSPIRLLLGNSVATDSFQYTIIDDDGDSSTATVYLTIVPTLIVDETADQQDNPKDTVSDRVSSADFSVAFASVVGVATYGLSVSGTNGALLADGVGVASGLFAVKTQGVGPGQEILLYNTGNGIEGRIDDPTGGDGEWVYFTIRTDAVGIVTLNLTLEPGNGSYPISIWHPDATNPDDVVSLNGGGVYEINLTQSADGASVSVDLAAGGGVFNFADDAPLAQDDFADNPLIVAGGVVSLNVLADNGAGRDLAGADSVFELGILGSSIVVTSDPDKGLLAYDGDGQFTYTAAAGAFGADSFEYTITDDDGDASTATVYLTIEESVVVQAAPLNAAGGDADTFVAVEGAPDVFAWSLGDETADGDLIIGFNPGEDAIDIADLLVGLDTTDLSQFLDVGWLMMVQVR